MLMLRVTREMMHMVDQHVQLHKMALTHGACLMLRRVGVKHNGA